MQQATTLCTTAASDGLCDIHVCQRCIGDSAGGFCDTYRRYLPLMMLFRLAPPHRYHARYGRTAHLLQARTIASTHQQLPGAPSALFSCAASALQWSSLGQQVAQLIGQKRRSPLFLRF
eukprot:6185773-Pleurochrysis_carterae.AAC.2